MKKIKILSIFLVLIFAAFLFLVNGFQTAVLNKIIKDKIESRIADSVVNFSNIRVSFNLQTLSIYLQLHKPEFEFKKNKFKINKASADIDLISIFTRQYSIKSVYLDVGETLVSNVSLLVSQINPQLNEISKKFLEGSVSGNININFNNFKDTKIKGILKNATIQFYENFPFATLINANFEYKDLVLKINIQSGKVADLDIEDTNVYIDQGSKDQLSLKTKIKIKGKIDYLTKLKAFTKLSSSYFPNEIKNLRGDLSLNIILDVVLNNDLSIKTIKSNSEIKTIDASFDYFLDPKKKEKAIITKFNSISNLIDKQFTTKGTFFINNNFTNFSFSKNINSNYFLTSFFGTINASEINSFAKTKVIDGSLDYRINFNSDKGLNIFDINLDLEKSTFNIKNINYEKKSGDKAKLNFLINKLKDKIIISNLLYQGKNSEIQIDNLVLNQDNKIENFKEIKVKTPNNSFHLSKSKNLINLNGDSLDLTEFVKSLTDNKKNEKSISVFLNTNIEAKINKVYLGKDELNEFVLSGKIKNSEYETLNVFGSFSNLETLSIQIFRNKKNNLETKLISDRSVPLLLGLNFAQGFTNGKISFNSEQINTNQSISKVLLTNYYVKKMPILAELLSLTSFTGIIDTLSGKGVFFKKSYLEFEKKDGVINILNAYGTGDSLGYTIEGQIQKDGHVSIDGNLVPAYIINDIIKQVPIIGKIITGKQGDGIFGASFKIRGQPDKLKTTVNPIRTLTPRFIQRFFDLFKKL